MTIKDKNQPLLMIKTGMTFIHLPPEFCSIDGVPKAIRDDKRKMRGILETCRKAPMDKIDDISKFTSNLFQQQPLANWGINIDPVPLTMNT